MNLGQNTISAASKHLLTIFWNHLLEESLRKILHWYSKITDIIEFINIYVHSQGNLWLSYELLASWSRILASLSMEDVERAPHSDIWEAQPHWWMSRLSQRHFVERGTYPASTIPLHTSNYMLESAWQVLGRLWKAHDIWESLRDPVFTESSFPDCLSGDIQTSIHGAVIPKVCTQAHVRQFFFRYLVYLV